MAEGEFDDRPGAVGPALDRLRSVTEELKAHLAAQRADGLTGERWLARMASLETRLSMVEGTLRAEAERVHVAVSTVDALTDRLRDSLAGAETVTTT
ncbi:MAG: hypothetical protein H0W25_01585, partial [Acidimicrobiia bacterium]|nr:hypothetical protein [Acidimicrobiia bacterium]